MNSLGHAHTVVTALLTGCLAGCLTACGGCERRSAVSLTSDLLLPPSQPSGPVNLPGLEDMQKAWVAGATDAGVNTPVSYQDFIFESASLGRIDGGDFVFLEAVTLALDGGVSPAFPGLIANATSLDGGSNQLSLDTTSAVTEYALDGLTAQATFVYRSDAGAVMPVHIELVVSGKAYLY